MNIRTIFSALLLALPLVAPAQTADYRESPEYLVLRDSMHHGFNDGDSARFYVAVRNLEKFLLAKNDLHAYYTQRCNEIVFELNRMNIFEAYKGAQQLSKELTEMADSLVKIPMEGKLESLNAAVAAALLIYEAKRQRS